MNSSALEMNVLRVDYSQHSSNDHQHEYNEIPSGKSVTS